MCPWPKWDALTCKISMHLTRRAAKRQTGSLHLHMFCPGFMMCSKQTLKWLHSVDCTHRVSPGPLWQDTTLTTSCKTRFYINITLGRLHTPCQSRTLVTGYNLTTSCKPGFTSTLHSVDCTHRVSPGPLWQDTTLTTSCKPDFTSTLNVEEPLLYGGAGMDIHVFWNVAQCRLGVSDVSLEVVASSSSGSTVQEDWTTRPRDEDTTILRTSIMFPSRHGATSIFCIATVRTSNLAVLGYFFSYDSKALAGLGLLIIDFSRSHSDTPHSVGLPGRMISPTQRPLPDNTQHSQQTCIPSGIWTRNPRKRAPAEPRLKTARPLGSVVQGY
jgi:hypothetical protein